MANWVAKAPAGRWTYLACSDTGMKLVATIISGKIWNSTDAGETWVERISVANQNWSKVVSSADGTYLAASVMYGYIYTSDDGGETWTQRATSKQWRDMAMSADGQTIYAIEYPNAGVGYIWKSTDGGQNWSPGLYARNWECIACSANGQIIIASDKDHRWQSQNGGANWAQTLPLTASTMVLSADGQIGYAASYASGSTIWKTVNGGQTWLSRSTPNNLSIQVRSISCSSDGANVILSTAANGIYRSTDYGDTYFKDLDSPISFVDVAVNQDGTKFFATYDSSLYGHVYVLDFGGKFSLTSTTKVVKVAQTPSELITNPYAQEVVPIPYALALTLTTGDTKTLAVSVEVSDWLQANQGATITGAGIGLRSWRGQLSNIAFVEFNGNQYKQIPVNVFEFLTGQKYSDDAPPTGVLPVLM